MTTPSQTDVIPSAQLFYFFYFFNNMKQFENMGDEFLQNHSIYIILTFRSDEMNPTGKMCRSCSVATCEDRLGQSGN